MSTIIQQNQQANHAVIGKPFRIPVYQTSEKAQVMNMVSMNNKFIGQSKHNTPELAVIIEKLTGQQTGIIIGKDPSRCRALFSQFSYEIKRVTLHEEDDNDRNVPGNHPEFLKACVSKYVSVMAENDKSSRKLIWINLPEKGPLKISDLQSIVQVQIDAGVTVEWISIIQHPSHQHLFKWELIC